MENVRHLPSPSSLRSATSPKGRGKGVRAARSTGAADFEKSRLFSVCEKIRQLLLEGAADGGAVRLAALTAQQVDVP